MCMCMCIWTGWSWKAVVLTVVVFVLRLFFPITDDVEEAPFGRLFFIFIHMLQ